MPSGVVLSAAELKLLGRLGLTFRQRISGLNPGTRRSARAARSPEFSDFRPYVPGDDYRQIDWLAFARLERLMLRLYVAEEESCLNIVLDTSASMSLGDPPKWLAAKKLAAALGFLGIAGMDRIQVGELSSRNRYVGPLRGRRGLNRISVFLDALVLGESGSATQFAQLRWLRPGMTVLISDFLIENVSWNSVLTVLSGRRQEIVLWQILARDEESPTIRGDVTLIDVEGDRGLEMTITQDLVRRYRSQLAQHRESLTEAARASRGQFLHSVSTADLATLMLEGLRVGIIRRA